MYKFADATGGYVDVGRKATGRNSHRLHKDLQQNFAGVDFVKQFSHVRLLVVHNFNLMRAILMPDKAHTPLVIHAPQFGAQVRF
jgi:hypothetical protein